MKSKLKSIFSIITAFCLLASVFAGCSSSSKKLDIIYPFDGNINSYDPQVAATQDEFLITENCFEGLVRLEDDKTIKPAAATSWSISSDKKTYTFQIQKGLKWHIGEEVQKLMGESWNPDITANDFVFALKRAVKSETECPLYSAVSNIKNAKEVNSGKSSSLLGAKATGDYTLQIDLSSPDEAFLATLTTAAAMPCNEEFFNATKGRYGLGTQYSLFNGQFYVDTQLETSYVLDKNESYAGPNQTEVDNITLNIKDSNTNIPQNLESGYYDAAYVSGSVFEKLDSKKISANAYSNITWSLLINASSGALAESKLREAIGLGVSQVDVSSSKHLQNATGIVPPCCTVNDKTITSSNKKTALSYDPNTAKSRWKEGLTITEASTISLTLITTEEMNPYAKKLVQGLQESIGSITTYSNSNAIALSLKIETMTKSKMDNKIATDDYDLALYPFEAASSNPGAFLSSIIKSNFANYSSSSTGDALQKAENASATDAPDAYYNCEKALINTFTVLPIFYESSYYAMASGVSGIQFHPGSGRVSFVEAKRKK